MISLPKKLKVGGHVYKVKTLKYFKDQRDLVGLHSEHDRVITVAIQYSSLDRNIQQLLETLLHESIHAIDSVYCERSFSETIVEKLSEALYCVLAANDLFLGTNKVIERINILGTMFKIIHPYEFETMVEEGSCSTTAYNECEFRIADRIEDISISRTNLEECIIRMVCGVIVSSSWFSEVDLENFKIFAFSQGLYQFLKENKFDELVRKCYNERNV